MWDLEGRKNRGLIIIGGEILCTTVQTCGIQKEKNRERMMSSANLQGPGRVKKKKKIKHVACVFVIETRFRS